MGGAGQKGVGGREEEGAGIGTEGDMHAKQFRVGWMGGCWQGSWAPVNQRTSAGPAQS